MQHARCGVTKGSCGEAVGKLGEPCGARADAAEAACGGAIARSPNLVCSSLYLRSPCALVPLSTRPRPPADLGSGSASNLDGNTRKKIGYNMNLSVVCCVRTLASRVPRLAPGSPPRVPHATRSLRAIRQKYMINVYKRFRFTFESVARLRTEPRAFRLTARSQPQPSITITYQACSRRPPRRRHVAPGRPCTRYP